MTPKTITAKIVVPEWVKWRATEKNGAVYYYFRKPIAGNGMWIKSEAGGAMGFAFDTTPPRNWRKTLRRVK
jgi:hypothetical protein